MTDPMALYDAEWEHRRAVHPKWPLPSWSDEPEDAPGLDCA